MERRATSVEEERRPNLKECIGSYFERKFRTPYKLHTIRNFADQIRNSASEGGKALSKDLVIVPVAHDELESTIYSSIANYAKQRKPDMTLIYGLDRPRGEELNENQLALLRQAKEDFPELDIRVVDMGIHELYGIDGEKISCVIPGVQKNLIGGVLQALLDEPNIRADYMLHIHDVDIQQLSPNFFVILEEEHTKNPDAPLMPKGEHAIYPLLPGLSEQIIFCDMYDIFSEDAPIFEPALSIPLRTYCDSDGIEDNGQIGQIINLLSRTNTDTIYVKRVVATASGRRHAERFSTGTGVIWSEKFELPNQNYRAREPVEDLTSKQQQSVYSSTEISNNDSFCTNFEHFIRRRADESLPFEAVRNELWAWIKENLVEYYESYLQKTQTFRDEGHIDLTTFKALMNGEITTIDATLQKSWALVFLGMSHRAGIRSLVNFYGVKWYEELGGFDFLHMFLINALEKSTGYTRIYAQYTQASDEIAIYNERLRPAA